MYGAPRRGPSTKCAVFHKKQQHALRTAKASVFFGKMERSDATFLAITSKFQEFVDCDVTDQNHRQKLSGLVHSEVLCGTFIRITNGLDLPREEIRNIRICFGSPARNLSLFFEESEPFDTW